MIPTQYIRQITLLRDKVEDFKKYPFSLPAIRNLEDLDIHPKATILVGENGSGKSTLLEAIAVALGFNAEGGTRNFNFHTRQSHSELYKYLRVTKGTKRPRDGFFLRAESFFNVATEIERMDTDEEPCFAPPVIDSYGGISLHEQSHGEAFLALMINRFSGHGVYILDEPEAALSPKRQLAVLVRMHDLIQSESQFIMATHSPILMAYPDAQIYQCGAKGVEKIAYEETEHFQVTRNFLSDPQRMLQMLLKPQQD